METKLGEVDEFPVECPNEERDAFGKKPAAGSVCVTSYLVYRGVEPDRANHVVSY
jgi:hypothetical protein